MAFIQIVKSVHERQKLSATAEKAMNSECQNEGMQEFLSQMFCIGQRYSLINLMLA